jgi:hypothetical protein
VSDSPVSRSLRPKSPLSARQRRRTPSRAAGLGLACLVAAVALAGCTTAGAPAADNATLNPGLTGATPAGEAASQGAPADAPSRLAPPAAPIAIEAQLISTGPDTYRAEDLSWTPPPGPISGYYLKITQPAIDYSPPPEVCDSSWTRVSGSAKGYHIQAVETPPIIFICAFNDAGTSPTVQFPEAMQPV